MWSFSMRDCVTQIKPYGSHVFPRPAPFNNVYMQGLILCNKLHEEVCFIYLKWNKHVDELNISYKLWIMSINSLSAAIIRVDRCICAVH